MKFQNCSKAIICRSAMMEFTSLYACLPINIEDLSYHPKEMESETMAPVQTDSCLILCSAHGLKKLE